LPRIAVAVRGAPLVAPLEQAFDSARNGFRQLPNFGVRWRRQRHERLRCRTRRCAPCCAFASRRPVRTAHSEGQVNPVIRLTRRLGEKVAENPEYISPSSATVRLQTSTRIRKPKLTVMNRA
jgi:hypothetical protein